MFCRNLPIQCLFLGGTGKERCLDGHSHYYPEDFQLPSTSYAIDKRSMGQCGGPSVSSRPT